MLVVEPARRADVRDVVTLARSTLSDELDGGWLAAHVAWSQGNVLVARDVGRDRIVGFCLAERQQPCEGHVVALAIDPEVQGQGLGKALLGSTREALRQSGAMHCHLDVRADDVVAQAFYLRNGFTPEGLEKQRYRDGTAAVRYGMPL